MMRFENQNRYKQYIPQESTRPFLPILMVKTDNSQAVTRNVFKHVKRGFFNLFEQVLRLRHRFQPVANG
jgi:RNase P protein component